MLIVTAHYFFSFSLSFYFSSCLVCLKNKKKWNEKSAEQTQIDVKFVGLFIIKKLVIKRFMNISVDVQENKHIIPFRDSHIHS